MKVLHNRLPALEELEEAEGREPIFSVFTKAALFEAGWRPGCDVGEFVRKNGLYESDSLFVHVCDPITPEQYGEHILKRLDRRNDSMRLLPFNFISESGLKFSPPVTK